MNNFTLRLCAFAVAFLFGGTAFAQNELYNNGASIYLTGNAAVYVQGTATNTGAGLIQLTGAASVLELQTTSGPSVGDLVMNNAAATVNNSGTIRLNRNWTQTNGTLTSNAGSVVEFYGTGTSTYSLGTGITEANSDFNSVIVNKTSAWPNNALILQNTGGAYQDGNLVTQTLTLTDGYVRTHPTDPIGNATPRVDVRSVAAGAITGYQGTPGAVADVGHVWGRLRRYVNGTTETQFDFPVGTQASVMNMRLEFNNNTFYNNVNTAQPMSYIDVYYDSADPNTQLLGVCGPTEINSYTGKWEYTPYSTAGAQISNLTGASTYALTLHPRNLSPTGTVWTIQIRHGADPWEIAGTGVMTADGEECVSMGAWTNLYTPSLQTEFSGAKGGEETDTPFPVEGLDLIATPIIRSIMLDWATLRETNCAFFDLERSLDSENFSVIAAGVPGHGTTDVPQNYRFEDFDVQYNVPYFYRVRQVDLDGTSRFSQVREAILTGSGEGSDFSAVFYPNPTNGGLFLNLKLGEATKFNVTMYDAIGKQLIEKIYDLPAGVHDLDLSAETETFAVGTYNAVLSGGAKVYTQKIVKTR